MERTSEAVSWLSLKIDGGLPCLRLLEPSQFVLRNGGRIDCCQRIISAPAQLGGEGKGSQLREGKGKGKGASRTTPTSQLATTPASPPRTKRTGLLCGCVGPSSAGQSASCKSRSNFSTTAKPTPTVAQAPLTTQHTRSLLPAHQLSCADLWHPRVLNKPYPLSIQKDQPLPQ